MLSAHEPTLPALPVDYGLWAKYRHLDSSDAFENLVMGDRDNVWVVAFINPECNSCKNFAPQWDSMI